MRSRQGGYELAVRVLAAVALAGPVGAAPGCDDDRDTRGGGADRPADGGTGEDAGAGGEGEGEGGLAFDPVQGFVVAIDRLAAGDDELSPLLYPFYFVFQDGENGVVGAPDDSTGQYALVEFTHAYGPATVGQDEREGYELTLPGPDLRFFWGVERPIGVDEVFPVWTQDGVATPGFPEAYQERWGGGQVPPEVFEEGTGYLLAGGEPQPGEGEGEGSGGEGEGEGSGGEGEGEGGGMKLFCCTASYSCGCLYATCPDECSFSPVQTVSASQCLYGRTAQEAASLFSAPPLCDYCHNYMGTIPPPGVICVE